ncbi:hypothetical protein GPL21_40145 [Bradyrhizobium pachyrhizi]|uniref:Transposase DDE domain-containing protein n=1 Tax=Bradyrhizobium pachyrhizi TaxID=280333 RepID=A0A844T824_9BRAD|nr:MULTISPECIES: hypothetical protein [Bradyrhizobium]MVT71231.1 hypothetical protein [Bradyrhizobium pachyrhizi]WFU60157.1 hypothetical protein QA639_33480 [Bradyrhizobium pachyrhizi]
MAKHGDAEGTDGGGRRALSYEAAAIEALPVTLFLEAHKRAPKQIILDLDATGDVPGSVEFLKRSALPPLSR